jgi:hypothetical protein
MGFHYDGGTGWIAQEELKKYKTHFVDGFWALTILSAKVESTVQNGFQGTS